MVDKILITNKLENFFKKTEPQNLLKVFVIGFLFDKVNYVASIVGDEDAVNMLDKWVYNLENNVKLFETIEGYNSIYVHYDFDNKSLKYYMTDEYSGITDKTMSYNEKKVLIIKEFKILMYTELEMIVNIHVYKDKIVSNGFYIEDDEGRYPEYDGEYSKITRIFAEDEVCTMLNVNDRIKYYIDDRKRQYVYAKHYSQSNYEVLGYVTVWCKFLNKKLYYYANNHPIKYSWLLMEEFNRRYEHVLAKRKQNLLLESDDMFSLIEKYILYILNGINSVHMVRYHQDLSNIFRWMNHSGQVSELSMDLMQDESREDTMGFDEI